MEPLRSLEELQNFLDTGGDVNASFPALLGTGSWTLLHRAAFTGTPDMVSLLLQRGASMEPLTNENKSAVDLACDAESWGSFELLKSAADDRYPRINVPYRRRGSHLRSFFPSEFFVKLRNTIDDHMENIGLKDFEDMIQRTRELKAAGQLSAMVPYPEENYHLIIPYEHATAVASMLQQKGENVERALAYAGFWLHRCLKYHSCVEIRPFSDILWPVLPKRIVDVSRVAHGLIKLVDGRPKRAPYCALSYRWQDHAITTTAESIAAFSREIPLNRLQTQIKDAFLIANRLGIRYVWVDALCIIQKSEAGPGDFDEEAPKMEQEHKEHRSRPLGDLDTRGWALQEQLLSQRVLYITKNGLFWECLDNSMSESHPCGIPEPSDGFRAADDRKLKKFMLQAELPSDARTMLMCMWRRNVVEEYSRRHLTFDEDRLMAAASVTSRLATPLKDECLAGIWKQEAVRSLVWHTAAPSSRPRNLVFPSWSWYSIRGPVVYSAYTPFNTKAQRESHGSSLKDDMTDANFKVLEISCVPEGSNGKVYRGRALLRGITLRAYFASGDQNCLYFPRERGAEKELIRDLKKGTLRPALHDGGPQPEFNYIAEFPFVDTLDFPGSKGYREVLCVIMGYNKIDGAFPVALVLEKVNENNEYQRVGTVAIDTRQISFEKMGDIRTLTIV